MDDSTNVYKIAAVSTKVRYNDFWSNYGDRYMAVPFTETELAENNDDLYPVNVEVCLRVKPNTAAGFSERLMELSVKCRKPLHTESTRLRSDTRNLQS